MSTIIGELAAEAGFPAGVLNVVSGKEPALLGEIPVTDPRVDVISFSPARLRCRRIMEIGGPTLKRLFLELGGKSAAIIFENAPNFAEAVGQSTFAITGARAARRSRDCWYRKPLRRSGDGAGTRL
ncbi:aldehyde dehydrogenase family protein [Novosphingobium sp. G106]|uniref:aldehyde dehydrogenase family protein n=1 Tax=Novosphingobium sp. G106 TaxID=2849500 RepID=UPI0020C32F90|nr:aldehyde dehydrogenase family protein [Novosphingobium sp. G106]